MRTLVRSGRADLKECKGALKRGLDADLLVLDVAGLEQFFRSTQVLTQDANPGFSSTLAFRHFLLREELRVWDSALIEPDRPQGPPLQSSVAALSFA